MSNIFSLSAEYQQAMNEIMATDELTEEMLQKIESINGSIDSKILNYTSIAKELDAKSKSIDNVICNMEERKNRLENASYKLKEKMKKILMECNKFDPIENEYHRVILRNNNPKTNITDKSIIPKDYLRYKFTEIVEPDKVKILKDLKNNIVIPGVELLIETRLDIK